MDSRSRLQWTLTVQIYHGPSFGHSIEMLTHTNGRDGETIDSLGSWRGVGVPEDVLKQARALVDAALTQHLLTRYGIAGQLGSDGLSEVSPF